MSRQGVLSRMITCLDKGLALFVASQVRLSCANTLSPGMGGSARCHPAMPRGFGSVPWAGLPAAAPLLPFGGRAPRSSDALGRAPAGSAPRARPSPARCRAACWGAAAAVLLPAPLGQPGPRAFGSAAWGEHGVQQPAPGTFLKAADKQGPAAPAPRSGGSQSGSLSPAEICVGSRLSQRWRRWTCLLGRSCLEGSHISSSSSAPGKGRGAPCSATQPGPAGNSSLAAASQGLGPQRRANPQGTQGTNQAGGGEATAASVPMHGAGYGAGSAHSCRRGKSPFRKGSPEGQQNIYSEGGARTALSRAGVLPSLQPRASRC